MLQRRAAAAGPRSAMAPERRSRAPGEGEPLRALLWGRAVPAGLFSVLAWVVLQRLLESLSSLGDHPSWIEWAGGPVRALVYFFFCAIPVALIITRPAPVARDGTVGVRVAAVTGTVMLLAAGFVLPTEPRLYTLPASGAAAATGLLMLMQVLALYGLLSLRTSFSIIPEARRLVDRGPYRLVRHPLYSAEIGAAVAVVIPGPTPWAVALVAAFVGVQIFRATREEALLVRSLPGYARYREHTWALIPLVW